MLAIVYELLLTLLMALETEEHSLISSCSHLSPDALTSLLHNHWDTISVCYPETLTLPATRLLLRVW